MRDDSNLTKRERQARAATMSRVEPEDLSRFEEEGGRQVPEHKKALTFGDLIVSVYSACSHPQARAIVRFAVNAHLVVFRGQGRYVI